jgi:hypothetical protein
MADQNTMQFEEDDEFEGIVAVIRDKLKGLSGVLHVSGVVNNAPDYLLPVQDWCDFHYFSKIREAMSVLDPSSIDRHVDFVWVSVPSPLRISRLLLEIIIECIN